MSPFWIRKLTARLLRCQSRPYRRDSFRPRLHRLEDRALPSTTVTAVHVNDGSAQRSEVRSIAVDFSSKVFFSGGNPGAVNAFQVRRILDGSIVGLTATVVTG